LILRLTKPVGRLLDGGTGERYYKCSLCNSVFLSANGADKCCRRVKALEFCNDLTESATIADLAVRFAVAKPGIRVVGMK